MKSTHVQDHISVDINLEARIIEFRARHTPLDKMSLFLIAKHNQAQSNKPEHTKNAAFEIVGPQNLIALAIAKSFQMHPTSDASVTYLT